MNTGRVNNKPIDRLITPYLYGLVLISAILVFIVYSIFSFHYQKIDREASKARDFYLVGISLAEHIRNIIDRGRITLLKNHSTLYELEQHTISPLRNDTETLSNLEYELRDHINRVLSLHDKYPDPSFTPIVSKLKTNFEVFSNAPIEHADGVHTLDYENTDRLLKPVYIASHQLESLYTRKLNQTNHSEGILNNIETQSLIAIMLTTLMALVLINKIIRTATGITRSQLVINQALSENETQVRLLLNSTGEAIYGIDNNGCCTFANSACARLTGYDHADELLGKNMHDLIHHHYEDGSEYPVEKCQIFKAHITGKTVHSDSEVFWHKDGRAFPVEYYSHPVIDNGEIRGSVVTFTDITERKQKDLALVEQQASLNTAQSIAGVGSWVWDIKTGSISWSDEIYRIFGLQPQEFEATYEAFLERVHPDDRQFVINSVNDAVGENRVPYDINHLIVTPDGIVRAVHEKGIVFEDENGQPEKMIGAVHDVTETIRYQETLQHMVEEKTRELKETQDELVRKERLATLGQLTATVSHELRNPLGAVKPSLFIIEKKTQNLGDEKLQNAVARVDRNIARCDHIIDELLDFTRITDIEKRPVELDRFLETIMAEQQTAKGVSLVLDLKLEDRNVELDPNRFRRAFINIFENALHAILKNDSTDEYVEGAEIIIKTALNNNRAEVSVSDNGYGISDDVMQHIFEPLFSTKGFGVGLGMPTVKQILEQHSGGVDIDSEVSKGTCVTLWLPYSSNIEVTA